MKIYKTSKINIDKGILKELFSDGIWLISKKNAKHFIVKINTWNVECIPDINVIIDNRIKGYCLKEC